MNHDSDNDQTKAPPIQALRPPPKVSFKVPTIAQTDPANTISGVIQALSNSDIIEQLDEEPHGDYVEVQEAQQGTLDDFRQDSVKERNNASITEKLKERIKEEAYKANSSVNSEAPVTTDSWFTKETLADQQRAINGSAYEELGNATDNIEGDTPVDIQRTMNAARNNIIGDIVENSDVSRDQAIAAYDLLMAEISQAKERDNAELGKYSTLGNAAERMRALGADPLIDTVNFARSLEQEIIFQLKCRAGLVINKLGRPVRYSAALHSAVMAVYSKTLDTLLKYAYLTAEQSVVREEKKLEREIAKAALGQGGGGLVIELAGDESPEAQESDADDSITDVPVTHESSMRLVKTSAIHTDNQFKPVKNPGPNKPVH